MTIVETTASSEPSAISGTCSAEATTVRIHGNRSDTWASRSGSRSTAYTGRVSSMSLATTSAGKSGPSPHPRSASASGPDGRTRRSSEGSCSTSKWIAVSVYRSLTRARLRAAGPAVAGLALAAPDLEAAARTLEGAVPPFHVRAAAQADLDGFQRGLGGQRANLRARGGRLRLAAPAPWPSG